MPEEEHEVIAVSGVRGRAGILDPGDCEIVATVYKDYVRVRIDSGRDSVFWLEFPIPLDNTPAAPKTLNDEEAALDTIEGVVQTLSHAADCPARHSGECLCLRSALLGALSDHGRDV